MKPRVERFATFGQGIADSLSLARACRYGALLGLVNGNKAGIVRLARYGCATVSFSALSIELLP